jgi:hypothetical protein
MFKRCCEDPNTTYLCFGRFRLVFRYGKYAGWYDAKLEKVL